MALGGLGVQEGLQACSLELGNLGPQGGASGGVYDHPWSCILARVLLLGLTSNIPLR